MCYYYKHEKLIVSDWRVQQITMSSPSLKDLPKVALDLKSELEGFNHGCMKKASTAEKNVLPSAEGII